MACKIQKDLDGNITSVLAPNGNESQLFNAIASSKSIDDALLDYASTYTSEFTNAVDKHFGKLDSNEIYDVNNEVKFEIYNKIMNPELTLLKDSGFGNVPNPLLEDFILQVIGYRKVFQGTNEEVDNRKFNYFALDRQEALMYGPNVRETIINTDGFLRVKDSRSQFRDLVYKFYDETGKYFDILRNDEEGLKTQNEFFQFLKDKGYKGLDYTGYIDNQYLITFTNQDLEANTTNSGELYTNYHDRVYRFRDAKPATQKSERNKEFDSKLRTGLLEFIKGLNININEEADDLLDTINSNPVAAFDTLQKYLALRSDITDKDLAVQSANIIYTMIGKKSKLSIELWHNIRKWSKYDEFYKYYLKKLDQNYNTNDKYDSEYILETGEEYKGKTKNNWVHRQVIIQFIAEAIKIGADSKYFGEKRENVDIDKDYFKKLGFRNKYEENVILKLINEILNFIREKFKGIKVIDKDLSQEQLLNLALDIVDDVYKKDYSKFIRSYIKDESGQVRSLKNQELFEIKNFEKTLNSDPFAKEIITRLFDNPFIDYKASGSLTLRKFGTLFRAVSENLHDIDGVITYDQFKKESNALAFKTWLQTEGLALQANYKKTKFTKTASKYLEQQSWYINLKNLYPSWTLESVFIGRDHKRAESVTITGYVEHPTDTEIVEETGETRPKRYVIDFFLRTTEDERFPEQFEDNYWKAWKGIFEAKLNMGRAKDINDLIYFEPFKQDKFKFTNKGFRYFSFADDRVVNQIEFNRQIEAETLAEQSIEDKIDTLSFNTIRKIADRLSESLGNIPYYIVDRSEAKKILEEAGETYDNEGAFFFNGEVYIVNDAFTLNNVVHEFSHPFVKALQKNNPALFDKLYNELIQTEEGKQIEETVKELYKKKREGSAGFKEEVFVRALTKRASDKLIKQESSSLFKKIIDKILFNLKQMLRKVFGKVKIEKLNVDTTLEELAEMLTTDTFNISIKDVRNLEAEFSRETARESAKYLKDNRRIELNESINDFFKLIRKNQAQIDQGIRSDSSFYQVFTNTETERPFQDIIRNLKPYQTIEPTSTSVTSAIDYRQMQVQAFVDNMFNYEEGLDQIADEINLIISEGRDSQFALNRYSYLKDILEASLKSFEDITEGFNNQNVPVNSPIYQLVNELTSKATNSIKAIKKQYQILLPEIIAPQLEGLNKTIIDSYNETISRLEKAGKDPEKIARLKKERDSYVRDKNYIAKVLAGEEPEPATLGLSAFVESAISSPDGLISSFARMYKEAMIDVELTAINNYNDFLKELDPLIDAAGISFKNISSLGSLITRVQQKGYIDPTTNEFTTRDIVELLSPFKDYHQVLSKFSYDMNKAQQDGEEEQYVELKRQKEEFIRNYMHSDYLPVVYTTDDVFNKTFTDSNGVVHEVGKIARQRRDVILEKIRAADSIVIDELEKLEISSRLKKDTLWSEYYALYNKYMPDGQPKDEVEMAITEVLLENRKARKEFFEWESDLESDSMPIKRFEKARNAFKSHIATRFEIDSPEYKEALKNWDILNTRKVIDKSFYTQKQRIIQEIREIYDKINNTSTLSASEKEKIAKQNEILENKLLMIVDQLYGYRDEENHPNGLLISAEKAAKIKEAQEEINKIQESLKAGSGLTRSEKYRLNILAERLASGEDLTQDEQDELESLDSRNLNSTVPKAIRQQLSRKFEELNELQSKYPTKYYLIAINYRIEQLNQKLKDAGKPESQLVKTLDIFNVDELTRDVSYMEHVMKKDPAFKKWFLANHIKGLEWDTESSNYIEVYKRIPIWTEITPNEPEFFRQMTLSDGEVVFGMPTLNYYKQNIKPEYATPEFDENGVRTKDVKGRWLPRVIPNSPYINQEYFDLKANNRPVFDLLEKITEYYFKFQEKAEPVDRLGYEIPRYERTRKELVESNAFISGKVSGIKANLTNILNKLKENPEDFDSGLSTEDKFRLITLDQFEDDKGKIHISGKVMLEEDQVSRDVITSIVRHMFSIESAAKKRELHPTFNALVEVLEDPKNQPKDKTKASLYDSVFKKITVFANKKGMNTRAKATRAFVERNFYNVQQTGFGSDVTFLQKASRLMMAGASFGFFALDIVSAVKNRFGQQIQQAIELAAGNSYDAQSFLKGKIIASKAMMEVTASIYSRGKLPYHVQLINAFDPAQGRLAEKLPEMITRTIYKDAVDPLNATMSPRKFLEMEATLEYFYGVMENTKVEQTVNGVTTSIPYHEAFELVDGVLKLRQGIDEKYDLGGSEFKRLRLFIQEKQNILNGVFSIADQPEGNRYIFYRMFMFLRKFFVTQFLNRFGYGGSIFNPRYRTNIATESLEMGYWLQFARGLKNLITTMGDHYHYMLPQERAAMRKALGEMAILTILSILIPWMLGWDDDDDEKYAKLRERQGGPLGSENFQFGGWLANHALYQTLSVAQENTQFYDLSFYSSMASNFNLANGPTLKAYGKILDDVYGMVTGEDNAYYKKDVGPYPWQKAESAKIFNHLGKMFALTGKNIDPAQATKDFISAQNIY
jgi:hypothetical protein